MFTRVTFLLSTVCTLAGTLSAQDYVEISTGANYSQQSYVNIDDGTQKQINATTWDLAFNVTSGFSAGVLINESAGLDPQTSGGAIFYDARTTDFDAVLNVDSIVKHQIYNPDADWNIGALNALADPNNPFDQGWGDYNPATHEITGTRVFVVKLRDGSFRKFRILSLIQGNFAIEYATLDNNEPRSVTMDRKLYANQNFAYFSFTTGEFSHFDIGKDYDMSYQRYITIVENPDKPGDFQEYNVTGVLTAPGVKAVKISDVDPGTVKLDDYKDKFSSDPQTVGYDWKYFDGTTFSIVPNRSYLVQTKANGVYKIVFIDFEGASTGNAVFEKTYLGALAVAKGSTSELSFLASPNPATTELTLALNAQSEEDAELRISDFTGKIIYQQKVKLQSGLNGLSVNTSRIPAGSYVVSVLQRQSVASQRVVIQ
jgi:hypothetical protein